MTNGRLEKELKAEKKMQETLSELPYIFTEFYYSLRASKKSYTTMTVYIRYVRNFMDFITHNKPSNDFYKTVTGTDIEQYFISLETREVNGQVVRMGDSIQATRWSALNTFFDFLVNKKEYLAKNPMVKTDRPSINTDHKVTYLTKVEINKIMRVIDKNPSPVMAARDKTIVGLALSTGLRVSALTNINIEDIDFDNNVINVIEKRQKVREIQFGEQTKENLQRWIELRNQEFGDVDTNALFISKKKNRISVDAIADLLKKYTAEAGISKKITPHKLRSSAATTLAAKGATIQTIANILGHENINTTMIYIAALDEEKKKATDILDSMW